ncbi:hypothetical protein BH11PSE11_BH11PSE11_02310 [soil metagenome]
MSATNSEKTVQDVEDFWGKHPLFQGESDHEPGSKAWFLDHEGVYIRDCFAGNQPDAIFTKAMSPASKVLDVGCGPGFWVRYFLRSGIRDVNACDLTETAVSLTKRSLELFDLKADVRVGNAEQLPYADGVFDHVNCQGVIHHTPHPEKTLSEFHRVLKPGGTVCFSVYHRNFLLRNPVLLKLIARLFGRFIGLRGRGRENLLASGDAEEIVRLYDGSGNPIGKSYTRQELLAMTDGLFKIDEIRYFFFPARALPFRIPNVLHRFLHRQAGLMIILSGTRL